MNHPAFSRFGSVLDDLIRDAQLRLQAAEAAWAAKNAEALSTPQSNLALANVRSHEANALLMEVAAQRRALDALVPPIALPPPGGGGPPRRDEPPPFGTGTDQGPPSKAHQALNIALLTSPFWGLALLQWSRS